ncbi:hypothetical protein GW17_00048197 [Ensete ventricosum]|nr:hypothetical protein GW17_00048197 [Ensete ventricosum]
MVGGVAPHMYIASKSAAAELSQHGIRVNCISSLVYATALACEFMSTEGKQIEELIGGMANNSRARCCGRRT